MSVHTAAEVPPSLFDDLDQTPISDDTPENRTLDQLFWQFHSQNPDVFFRLRTMALDLHSRGHKHGSIKRLFEVLRWQHDLETIDGDSQFKLNNNFTSRYARLIEAREPRLAGFFSFRTLRT